MVGLSGAACQGGSWQSNLLANTFDSEKSGQIRQSRLCRVIGFYREGGDSTWMTP